MHMYTYIQCVYLGRILTLQICYVCIYVYKLVFILTSTLSTLYMFYINYIFQAIQQPVLWPLYLESPHKNQNADMDSFHSTTFVDFLQMKLFNKTCTFFFLAALKTILNYYYFFRLCDSVRGSFAQFYAKEQAPSFAHRLCQWWRRSVVSLYTQDFFFFYLWGIQLLFYIC